MPVCIAGMARSGTSMSTRILNLCGLYLGEESDLLPPAPDNPDGFWENGRMVEINEDLLSLLGGAWDCPPVLPMELDERFARARAKAEMTLKTFADREPWGWKDPRNSLTLPFWRQYFPDMKVVICVRNPLEVAQSLYRRSWYSHELSMTLWHTYNQRVLSAVPPEQRIVTHYDSYFADPAAEIRRVLDFLGLAVADQRIADSCSAVSRGLRHHRFTTQQMLDVGVAPAVFDTYIALCIEAGVMREDARSGRQCDRADWAAYPMIEHGADGETRPPLLWQFGVGTAQAAEQPDSTQAGVGRLDRSAMDAILLRDQVRDLRAVVSDARDAYEKLQTVTREAEQHIRALTEQYEQRGVYIDSLQQRLAALAEEHEERGRYIDMLVQQETARTANDEEIRAYVRDLEGHVVSIQERDRAIHAYVRSLEERDQEVRAYARALEQHMAASETAYTGLAAYAHALEQHLATAQHNHEQLDTWATSLVRRLEILEEADRSQAEYERNLEQQLATAREELRGYEAAAQHQALSRQARLKGAFSGIWKHLRQRVGMYPHRVTGRHETCSLLRVSSRAKRTRDAALPRQTD